MRETRWNERKSQLPGSLLGPRTLVQLWRDLLAKWRGKVKLCVFFFTHCPGITSWSHSLTALLHNYVYVFRLSQNCQSKLVHHFEPFLSQIFHFMRQENLQQVLRTIISHCKNSTRGTLSKQVYTIRFCLLKYISKMWVFFFGLFRINRIKLYKLWNKFLRFGRSNE